MSELGHKVKLLREERKLTGKAAASKTGISRESILRIESGDNVKLDTLRQIATGYKVSKSQWNELLICWLKLELGPDSKNLIIETREDGPSTLHDSTASLTAEAMMLFTDLTTRDREQIVLTMKRKRVMACLPHINDAYGKL